MVCPNRQELSDFALGKLAEGAIDTVAKHVDECADCQKTISLLAPSEDTFLAKLKQVRKVSAEAAAEAGKKGASLSPPPLPAGKIDPSPAASPVGSPSSLASAASGRPMPVSCEAFAQSVCQLGLAEVEEATEITNSVPTEKRSDAQAVAKIYIERGKLTKYQAAAIYQGKAGTLTYGDYLVLDRIGAGGMGQVFKARHRRMDRLVALKVMSAAAMNNADSVKRFEREVKAAAKLSHTNIVTAYDAGAQDGVHYLVMELVDGPDMSALLKKHGKLPVKNVVDFIAQAAKGLAYAHGKGIVHRDIKPGNLLVDSTGVVKILDMGLARLDHAGMSTAKTDHDLTQSGAVMGTVDYMAPEQALNTRHADAKSDVYSLGCTLYRLLIGEPMYGGETMVEKILAHREQAVPSLRTKRPDAPTALDAIFQRMVAKKPDERPNMQEIADTLGSLDNAAAGLSGLNLSKGPGSSSVGLPGASGIGLAGPAGVSPPVAAEINVAPPIATAVPTGRLTPAAPGPGKSAKPKTKAGGPPKKKSNVMLLAAAGAAAACIALGVWIYVKDKDGNTVGALHVPDGGTVTLIPPAAATPTAAPTGTTPTVSLDPSKMFALPQATGTTAGNNPSLPPEPAKWYGPSPLVAGQETQLQPGLARTLYPRHDRQASGDGAYLEPDALGTPLPQDPADAVVTNVDGWTFPQEFNATAAGYLKIDVPGDYAFISNSFYDRNALFINGKVVCGYRNGEGTMVIVKLDAGYAPVLSVGYFASRGKTNVTWRTPGSPTFSAIPSTALFHLPAGSTPAVATTSQPSGAGGWIDLLPLIEFPKDNLSGPWSKVNGEVVVARKDRSKMWIPVLPTGGFDFEMEFTRLTGERHIGVFFPVGPQQTMFVIGDRASGLMDLNGVLYTDPANPTHRSSNPPNKQRHRLTLESRPQGTTARIIARLDNVVVLDWQGDVSAFAGDYLRTRWSLGPPNLKLGLAATDSDITYHVLKIRPVDGELKPTRPGVVIPATVVAGSSPPTAVGGLSPQGGVSGGWTALLPLPQKDRDTQDAYWTVTGELAKFAAGKPRAYVWIPYPVRGDYDVNMHLKITRAKESTVLTLPVGDANCVKLDIKGDAGNSESPTATTRLFGIKTPPPALGDVKVNIGTEYHFTGRVRFASPRVSVEIDRDGQPLYRWTGTTADLTLKMSAAHPNLLQLDTGYYTTSEIRELRIRPAGAAATPIIAVSSPPTAVGGLTPSPAAPVDLLALVQLPRDVVEGTWTRNGATIRGSGAGLPRIQIPYAPPTPEYDFIFTGRRVNGAQDKAGAVFLGLIAGGKQCYFRVGRGQVGFSDGNAIKAPHFVAGDLNFDVPATMLCAVRRDSIRFDLNGRTVLEYRGDFSDVARNADLAVPRADQLFLAIDDGVDLELTGLKLIPVGAAAPAISVATAPATPLGTWIELIPQVDLARDVVAGDWYWEKGIVMCRRAFCSRFQFPVVATGSYDCEFEFASHGGPHNAMAFLPVGQAQTAFCFSQFQSKYNGLLVIDGKRAGDATPSIGGPTMVDARKYKASFEVRLSGGQAQIVGRIDGQEVLRWQGDPKRLGIDAVGSSDGWWMPKTPCFGFGNQKDFLHVHSARVRLLDGELKSIHGAGVRSAVATSSPLGVPTPFAPLTPTAPVIPAVPAERKPVPDAATLVETAKLIKDIFKDDYADALKSPEKKSPLAHKLLQQAGQPGNEPVQLYALLDEAKKLAIDSGDLLALRGAIETLTREFEIEPTEAFTTAWDEVLRKPRAPQTVKVLHDEAVALFGPAVSEARFDDAKKFADFALNAARRMQDAAVTKQATDRNLALAARRTEWDAVKAAAEKLQASPDDGAANLAVGRYRAFVEGDWARALPLLAKGSDEVLKGLAEKSLAPAADSAALATIADAWWDAAQTAPATKKSEFYAGAIHWYKQAAVGAQGLSKTRIDKRVADSQAAVPEQKLPPTRLASLPQFASEAGPVVGSVPKTFDLGPSNPASAPPTQPAAPLGPATNTRPVPAGFRLPPNAVPGLIGRITLTDANKNPAVDVGVLLTYAHGAYFGQEAIENLLGNASPGITVTNRITVQLAGVLHVPADMEVAIWHAGGSASGGHAFVYIDGKEVSHCGDDRTKNDGPRVQLARGEHTLGWKLTGGRISSCLLDIMDAKTGEPLYVYATAEIVASARSVPTKQQVDITPTDKRLPPRPPTLPPPPATPSPPGVGSTFTPSGGLPLVSAPPTTPSPGAPAAPLPAGGDADARAAQWLASVGAKFTVQTRDGKNYAHPAKPLPTEPFQIISFSARSCTAVNDAGLANLAGVRGIRSADIAATSISGTGLSQLAASADALTNLNLDGCPITDAGTAAFPLFKNLQSLHLRGAKITDAGLGAVVGLRQLLNIGLDGTAITDAGLVHLTNLPNLSSVVLRGTRITDAGMAAVGRMVNLTAIDLASNSLTGAGLAQLTRLRSLKSMNLDGTKVTAADLLPLQQALPECVFNLPTLPPEMKSPQPVPIPPKPATSGIVKLPGGFEEHTVVCNTPNALKDFFYDSLGTQAVIEGGELTVRKVGGGPRAAITYKTHFSQVKSVVIRGKILPESQREFRIACGEFLCVLNTRDRAECHFFTGEEKTAVPGNLMTPGQTHVLQFTPTRAGTVFSIDGKPIYEAGMIPNGTVTIYTIPKHAIAVESLTITGIPDPMPVTDLKGSNVK